MQCVCAIRDAHVCEVGGLCLSKGNSEKQGIRHSTGIIRRAAQDVLGQQARHADEHLPVRR